MIFKSGFREDLPLFLMVSPDAFGVGALRGDGTVVFVVGAFMGVE